MNPQENAVKRRATVVVETARNVADKAAALAVRPATVAVTAFGAATGAASAATFTLDTTEVVATIAGGVTALSAIGVAVLSLIVVIKLFKWAQRTL